MAVEIGQIIDGKYRVVSLLGEGGMGAVFGGEHLRLHRRVAIKVLHAALARDAEVVRRFEREAQAAGRIGNDHILEVLDIGELPGGEHFMVMEYLDGEPMNARLQRLGRMSPHQAYLIAREILEGLAAAHAAGIVHRDLKPANVFILREKAGRADYVKIIDFGISKFQVGGGDEHRTRTGFVIGTPSYMSPEQARGIAEADARADLYAVGVILFEAVVGRLPFVGASPTDLLFQIALGTAPTIQSLVDDIDPAFADIVHRAMARDPKERFPSAMAFLVALDAWAQTVPAAAVPAPRPPTATAVVTGPPAIVPAAFVDTAPSPQPRLRFEDSGSKGRASSGAPWANTDPSTSLRPGRGTVAVVGVLAAGIVLIGGVGTLLALRGQGAPPARATSTSGATASVAPTVPPVESLEAPAASASDDAIPGASLAPLDTGPSPSASASAPPGPARHRPPDRPGKPAASDASSSGYNPFGHL
jgi:serine/threonine-protein kinase